MDDFLARFMTDMAGRLSGPLTLPLFLQPAMAFEAIATALILALVPYLLPRGLVNRIARTRITTGVGGSK